MIFIVTTFSIVITFFDFQLVYVLTGGGPANSTHLMATYAYSLSMGAGQMGLGSAVGAQHGAGAGPPAGAAHPLRAQGLSAVSMVGELTWRKRIFGLWLPLLAFVVIALFPFTWMAATSLKTNAELYNPKAIPLTIQQPSLVHYIDLLEGDELPAGSSTPCWWR